ncbi:hypothetical protein ID866_8698, partial [Astraeus odoratus]
YSKDKEEKPSSPPPLWRPSQQEQRPKTRHDHRQQVSQAPPKPAFGSQALPPDRRQSPQLRRDHYHDENQIDRRNEYYRTLRTKARQEGDLMVQCYQQSDEAYRRGNRTSAKELSTKGGDHKRKMESLNAQASAWIFKENNLDCKPGEVDLHGLYVKEAIKYTKEAIVKAQNRGDPEIRLIVGKGLHSDGNVAKIKPALEEFMKKHNLPAEVDPGNAGILTVRLN